MARVELNNVNKEFGTRVKAVDEVSLTIEDRELVVLVGPSGCGKSTTLRLIAGLEELSRGEIKIGDRVVNRVAPKDRDIAMVFQNYALYPHMTVYQNMSFGLKLRAGGWLRRGWLRLTSPVAARQAAALRKAIPFRVKKAAGMLGIEHLLDRMPRQLSGGERQRVALGRAVVRNPAVFLFDEPLSNLDARLRVDMRREIKSLHQELEATMIFVTHDQVEAMTLGDRVVVMHEGRVQQVGRPGEVYNAPRNRFVAGFVGSPPMNFVEGCVEAGGETPFFGSGKARVSLAGWAQRTGENAADRRASCCSACGRRDVSVFPPEAPCASSPAKSAGRVKLVEHLGDAALIHVEVDAAPNETATDASSAPMIAKAPAASTFAAGDRVAVAIDAAAGSPVRSRIGPEPRRLTEHAQPITSQQIRWIPKSFCNWSSPSRSRRTSTAS